MASGISYTPDSGSVDTTFSDFALSDASCTAVNFTTTMTGCTWTKIDSTAGTWVSMPTFSGSSGSYKMTVDATDNEFSGVYTCTLSAVIYSSHGITTSLLSTTYNFVITIVNTCPTVVMTPPVLSNNTYTYQIDNANTTKP